MAEVIREGVIRIRLEQGDVTLKAPDFSPVQKAYEAQAKATAAIHAETERLNKSVGELSSRLSSVENSWSGVGDASQKAADEQEKFAALAYSQMRQADAAIREVGEGLYRVARAAVLLGVDSESGLGQMLQDMLRLQAAFDLFKGIGQIVRGTTAAIESLQLAVAANAATTATASSAQAALNTELAVTAAGATAAGTALSAMLGVLGLLAVAVVAVAQAIDNLTTSEAEAAEQAREMAKAAEEGRQRYRDWLSEAATLEKQLGDQIIERGTAEQRANELAARVARGQQAGGRVRRIIDDGVFGSGTASQAAALEREKDAITGALAALDKLGRMEQERLESAIKSRDAKIDEVKRAEKLVSLSQRAYDLEQQKLRSFQAQIGAASKLEQQQLIAIRDKLRAGQDISAFEENQLAQLGGEQGRNIVETRRASRGAAAGFGSDFFSGIDGASDGMKDAAAELAKAAQQLKEITSGASAAETVARLEKEKQELERQLEAFYQGQAEQARGMVESLKIITKELSDIKLTLATNQG